VRDDISPLPWSVARERFAADGVEYAVMLHVLVDAVRMPVPGTTPVPQPAWQSR
jgi:hypothetical protein